MKEIIKFNEIIKGLNTKIGEYETEISKLKLKLKETQNLLEDKTRDQTLINELTQKHKEEIDKLIKEYENKIDILKKNFENEKKIINETNSKAMSTQKMEIESKFKFEISQMEMKQTEKINSLNIEINKRETTIAELKKEIDNLKAELEEKKNLLQNVDSKILASQEELEKAKKKYEDLTKQLLHEYEEKSKSLDEKTKKNIEEFKQIYLSELDKIKEEYFTTIKLLEQKNSTLQSEVDELKEYLLSRPSKDEDIEMINKLKEEIKNLEKKMSDSDSLIEQFRNELLNREETYNGYFDRKPKVGFVNPIKDKAKLSIIKKNSQNMTSTMPLIKK